MALITLLLGLFMCLSVAHGRLGEGQESLILSQDQPKATLAGYLPVSAKDDGALFYTYYEASDAAPADAPIVVWLQGGPGCASSFGNFYELGPQLVTPELTLVPNPGAWNRLAALLFIDQPVGTGFSIAGTRRIPENEMEMAADLYVALQRFFKLHPHMRRRPLIISGESYAGKYVPSIGHLVLQQEAAAMETRGLQAGRGPALRHTRPLPVELLEGRGELGEAPLFQLRGLVIVSGLTDPAAQVGTHADVAHAMGLIDGRQWAHANTMQAQVQQLIADGMWGKAHELRGHVLSYISKAAGATTLLDVRRSEDYDANKVVDTFLNQPNVKEALGVPGGLRFESCSGRVGSVLGRDVMKSVKPLIPDLLDAMPLLLVQGQFDIQDGPASTEAWLKTLEWADRAAFWNATRTVIRGKDIPAGAGAGALSSCCSGAAGAPGSGPAGSGQRTGSGRSIAPGARQIRSGPQEGVDAALRVLGVEAGAGTIRAPGLAAGGIECGRRCEAVLAYWKSHGALSHVVVRDAGHMVPRDAGGTAQYILERWLKEVLG